MPEFDAHRSAYEREIDMTTNNFNIQQANTTQNPHKSAECRTSRRGSALLIVIGTLALISVFAAIYISIGRTDRRGATSVKSRIDLNSTTDNVTDYIATQIGNDRLEALVQHDGIGGVFGRREVIDVPYTDWTRRSETNLASGEDLFTVSGSPRSVGGISAESDYRVASDPWLASTTPVYLGNPGPANFDRPFSNLGFAEFGYNQVRPNQKNFLNNRDWLQISNFAPNGRFVNLINLRSNRVANSWSSGVSGREFGGFTSEPGVGYTVQSDGKRVRRMSNYLSLWRKANNTPESKIRAFDPGFDGVWIPGENDPVDIGLSATDVFNTPAVFNMYQRFMFMPMDQAFTTLNTSGDDASWADPEFPAYQYADADGDKMADSRWMELVSTSDLSEGNGTQPRDDIESLYDQKEYRFFIAARAVDLSSMVNVNTATDLLTPPTKEYPLGLTPADIDLRRLLTLQDPAADYSSFTSGRPLSMSDLHRPYPNPSTPADGRARWQDFSSPQVNYERKETDYHVYTHEYPGVTEAERDPREIIGNSASMLIGRYAYSALREGITLGSSLSKEYRGYNTDVPPLFTRTSRDLLQYQRDPTDINLVPGMITAEQRYDQYMKVGSLDPANQSTAWARGTEFGGALYGMDDLTELLSFFGMNDPQVTSRLERVTTGRYESPNDDVLQSRRYGPMMSNRQLELDAFSHGVYRDPFTEPIEPSDINGMISLSSMAHFALTPRTKMTTINGFVPLISSDLLNDPITSTALTQTSAAADLRSALSNPNALFSIYSGALAGELKTPNGFMQAPANWPTDPDTFQDHLASTLIYGHRGPELGLRIAAHSAVNMKDIADSDTDPSIATILVHNQMRNDLVTNQTNNFDNPGADSFYELYPGVADGNLLDPDPDMTRLTTGTLPDNRQAVNVYGLEAMPVLTEVSVLYGFTDSFGDGDFDPNHDASLIPGGDYDHHPDAMQVTINGDLSTANDDFLVQVLAFQLHNPYDQPISLGGSGLATNEPMTRKRLNDDENVIDPTANYQFDYYVEYAGRFYKLGEYIEWYPFMDSVVNYISDDDSESAFIDGVVNNPAVDDPDGSLLMPAGTESSASAGSNEGDFSNQSQYGDFIVRNIRLAPGETRVFYVISDKRFDGTNNADERWTRNLTGWGTLPRNFTAAGGNPDADGDLLFDGTDSRGWTGPAEEWVRSQLNVMGGQAPVMMMEFDPRDGKLLNETATGTLSDITVAHLSPVFGNRNDVDEARLWKKIVTNNEESNDLNVAASERTDRNLVENDLLVDRMSVDFVTDVTPLAPGDNPISDTVTYRESYPADTAGAASRNVRNDNTGITFAQWKTYRRLDSVTTDDPSIGQITPWMLRSLGNPSSTQTEHVDDLDIAFLGTEDFFTGTDLMDTEENLTILGDFEIQETIRDFWELGRDPTTGTIVQTLALQPHWKSDPVGASPDAGDAANDTTGKFAPSILSLTGTALEGIDPLNPVDAPEIFTSGSHIGEAPRLGDLLLGWGIGPSYAPKSARLVGTAEYVYDEWMTAPEAMAIALGFDEDPDAGLVGTNDEAASIWKDAYDVANTAENKLFDDGHLSLENYIAYVNMDVNTPPTFQQGIDIPRGTGVPMAMGVVDHARAIQPIDQLTDPDLSTGALTTREQSQLVLSRPTYGAVNINTAPVEVLRLLPGLTPSRATYSPNPLAANEVDEWWGKTYLGTNLPTLALTDVSQNPDVAAAIVAYRDRIYGAPTTSAMIETASSSNFYEAAPMNMEPTDPSYVANNMLEETELLSPLPATLSDPHTREAMSGIPGLRQTPGFGSLGELFAVRIDPEFETTSSARWNGLKHLSIQQYGHDDVESGIDNEITIMSQLFNGGNTGETIDDYAEKISMANSVLNTISVRSDYYAVWFVLHGYKESDVTNLNPEDPMVPSIKKRYLMVVDRTNVITPGDKPKILIFKELPI